MPLTISKKTQYGEQRSCVSWAATILFGFLPTSANWSFQERSPMRAPYAPYGDVFRCDAAFGETIKTHPTVQGRIMPKRRDLLTLLY
jgi:hypothetical protein